MESQPTLQTVCQAIQTLYHNPEPAGKEKASAYLGELQRSVFAWKIADELLQQKADLESCYFAAQTMRSKVQFSFHELPEASHLSLRDSLMDHINHVTSETSGVIVTQLCLALADLALQMASWKSPVTDLIARFGNNPESVSTLLEILTVLPEEINSRHLRLGANRRVQLNDNFCQVFQPVLQLLGTCVHTIAHSDPRFLKKVFKCLSSWFGIKGLQTNDQTLHLLLNCIFQVLANHETSSTVHDAASDALCSALVVVEDTTTHHQLAVILFQGVYTLVEAYNMSVVHEDIDKSINYCRIFTELAESVLDEMVSTPNGGLGSLQTLDLLLLCAGHHDFEVAEITFNVWYRLSELLYKRNEDSLNSVFEPYVQRLIVALCRHCQLDSDHEGVPDETDDFGEFRKRVSDLIKDVVFIIGSSKCFQQMFENLRCQGNYATWDATEASLFIMGAVAKNIVPKCVPREKPCVDSCDESRIVPQVLEAILNLPETSHIAVRYTSTYLLGELCDWIERHPQFLDPTLNFLLTCLQKKPLSTVAANALQNTCSTCKTQMASHFSGLLQIIQAIDTFSISNEAAVGLLKGTALILGEMPLDKITDGLMELIKTQMVPLSLLLKDDKDKMHEGTKSDPAVWLDRIAAIFSCFSCGKVENSCNSRYTTPNITNGQLHPCQAVVEKVWPLLSEICNKYQADVRVIERCCRCIRFAVRCVGKQSASLLEPLVTQMVHIYQVHQHSCFLYLGSVLVDEYGSEPGCTQGLIDMLQAFCGPAFRLLEGNDSLRNHPDTVDDLFRLCTRFLQWMPVPFLQCPTIKPIMQCAILAITLDHKDANTSVVKFFHDLIKGARTQDGNKQQDAASFHQRRALTQVLIAEHGQLIVNSSIQACVYCLPSFMLSSVADILYELNLFDKEALKIWLQNTLSLLPSQNCGGTVTATPEQLKEFLDNVSQAEHSKTVSSVVRDFARLYR